MAHGGFQDLPDPLLTGKIRDVIGLYLAPPANAAVFAVDEKPQIQVLQRTAPVLPMMPGVPERRSHDYVRHGTVDLFAALNTATGKVIGKLPAQHRATGWPTPASSCTSRRPSSSWLNLVPVNRSSARRHARVS